MEFEKFKEIRELFCLKHPEVTEGKMMSSPAIHYKSKVFAFFSKKHKMVFKLGKDYHLEKQDFEFSEFNPFKTKKPLSGWYEVDFEYHEKWRELTKIALNQIKAKS
ncbi:hypothetical protein DKG77_03015 [Flagellimonas aquimarina]|uniref:MmcQ/YjbR family DNA-binding protein n=1 Tax=Flagellimonas aquimarina TaxID=2201895 RepID=A0A316KZY9_9FLAO|nr:hypothetical protein [Allomuricauda koreensis]PWL39817.1 hypothetical protein DKG77_03015 [Allomuricauda koreensis]